MTDTKKPCLYFITPVFERYELAKICLTQKVDAIQQLEKEGINAQCVVVGDDDNIQTAKDLGLEYVIRQNDYLGAKFNDGHEYAAKHGATHVAPVGSDSWMDPAFIIGNLPQHKTILASKHYAMVHKTGIKRCQLFIPLYVSYVVPIKLLEACNFRPIYEKRHKGCDTNTMESVEANGPVRRIYSRNSHTLDTVAFQSPLQITEYDRIYSKWGVGETFDPFEDLREFYPNELVDQIINFYNVDNEFHSYDIIERCIPYINSKYRNDGNAQKLIFEMEACLIKRERELARRAANDNQSTVS